MFEAKGCRALSLLVSNGLQCNTGSGIAAAVSFDVCLAAVVMVTAVLGQRSSSSLW